MYYSDRRKKIVIAIVVIVLILIIGAGFAYAYFATDLFKSNQILFYKYLGQTVENFNYANNTQSLEFEKLKSKLFQEGLEELKIRHEEKITAREIAREETLVIPFNDFEILEETFI